MDYSGYSVNYMRWVNKAEVIEDETSKSGLLHIQAIQFDDGQSALAVNGEIAYHSYDSNAVSQLYNTFKKC